MSRLGSSIVLDVRLQSRSRLYSIGVAVAILMGLAGRFLFDAETTPVVLPIFYLLGIGGTTFMFGAAMLLLEKSQGTLLALRVSPLTAAEYLRSKALTLTTFALFEGVIVLALVYQGGGFAPPLLLAGLLVLGLSNTYIGIGMASSHESVTSFLFPWAVLVSMVLQLPFLGALDIGPQWLWALIPSSGPLALMLASFGAEIAWLHAIGTSLLLLFASIVYARARLQKHIGSTPGKL